MKSFLALALLVSSVSSFAFERSAVLDLTNVYGNNNVGLYEVTTEFTPKTTLSTSALSTSKKYDDGYVYCTTQAQFDVGEMKVTVINRKAGWTKHIIQKVKATIAQRSSDENCLTDKELFTGNQVVYASVGVEQFTLPVAAPLNYKTVEVYLAPFSGFLSLKTEITASGSNLVLNPSELLTERSVLESNSTHTNLNYYVIANGPQGGLSLANGSTALE